MVKDSPSGPRSAIKMLHKDEHALYWVVFSLYFLLGKCALKCIVNFKSQVFLLTGRLAVKEVSDLKTFPLVSRADLKGSLKVDIYCSFKKKYAPK